MSDIIKDGGPAFPSIYTSKDESGNLKTTINSGMSMRAWLAGLAMQTTIQKLTLADLQKHSADGCADMTAEAAIGFADAMISKLEINP